MPTDKNTIKTYNDNAQKWAAAKRDGSAIFHDFLEKPAMYAKLPDLKDKSVLCVGCGTGEEVEKLYQLGAKKVIGIDISENLIEIAKYTYPKFEFHVMDMENITLPQDSFDFAYSSLTMHYTNSWVPALKSVNKVLKKDSSFLFSISHPFVSASLKTETEDEKIRILGYKKNKSSETEIEIYGDYLNSHEVEYLWKNGMKIINYHFPFSEIIKQIRSSGFELTDIEEPRATEESKTKYERFWKTYQLMPEFIIFEIRKKII